MTALKSIAVYALSVVLFFLFWHWFFDKPSEHGILIPVLTGFCSSAVAAGIIEDAHLSDKGEEFMTYLVTSVVTSGFWVYLFYNSWQEFSAVEKNSVLLAVGTVITSWENLLMAAITFLVIMSKKIF